MTKTKSVKPTQKEQAFSTISVRSFVTVVAILLVVLIFCGSLSYFVPQGEFARDEKGNIIPMMLKEGDKVLFGKWSGTEIKVAGEDLLILKETDVLGVLE